MIRVLGDRVLVALPEKVHEQEAVTGYTFQPGETTESGLILAKPADVYNSSLATRGIVVQLGEKHAQIDLDEALALVDELSEVITASDFKTELSRLAPASFDIEIGDCVLFPPAAGDQIEHDGMAYVILHEDDILGVLEPVTKDEAA